MSNLNIKIDKLWICIMEEQFTAVAAMRNINFTDIKNDADLPRLYIKQTDIVKYFEISCVTFDWVKNKELFNVNNEIEVNMIINQKYKKEREELWLNIDLKETEPETFNKQFEKYLLKPTDAKLFSDTILLRAMPDMTKHFFSLKVQFDEMECFVDEFKVAKGLAFCALFWDYYLWC